MIRPALLSCALLLSFAAGAETGADIESSWVALARLQGYTDTLIEQCEQAAEATTEAEWLCAQSVRELDQLAFNLQDVCGGDTSADCNELDQELSRIRGFVAYRRGLQD